MKQRLNPTLFDKLVADLDLSGIRETEAEAVAASTTVARDSLVIYIPNIQRFNEQALRATVRREIAWLLNTVHLEALVDLTPYPQVKTSVLNYGVADLTGKSASGTAVNMRGVRIREAVLAFEPRLDPRSLTITPRQSQARDGEPPSRQESSVGFHIEGDITSAVEAMPVRFLTEIEVDTGAATVED